MRLEYRLLFSLKVVPSTFLDHNKAIFGESIFFKMLIPICFVQKNMTHFFTILDTVERRTYVSKMPIGQNSEL